MPARSEYGSVIFSHFKKQSRLSVGAILSYAVTGQGKHRISPTGVSGSGECDD